MRPSWLIVTGIAAAAFIGGTYFASPSWVANSGHPHAVRSADTSASTGNNTAPPTQASVTDKEESSTAEQPGEASLPVLPAQQITFLSFLKEARDTFAKTDNPVEKALVIDTYTSRCKQSIRNNFDIHHWIGKVEGVDRDKYIAGIDIDDARYFGTYGAYISTNNPQDNMELKNKIANLKSGDRIVLSGHAEIEDTSKKDADAGAINICGARLSNGNPQDKSTTPSNDFIYAEFTIVPDELTVLAHAGPNDPDADD